MKKLIVVLCALCLTGTIWAQRRKGTTTQQSTVRRAFEKREKLDPTMGGALSPDEAFTNAVLNGEGNSAVLRLREQRWRDWLTRIPRLVETKNIVSVRLAKGEKTNQWIVTLVDIDGKQTSLWCAADPGDGNIPVREITPH